MKKVKVFLFLAVFAFAFLLLGANVKTNAATTTLATSDKIVVKGASVRLTDPSGLRFVGTTDGYVAPEGKNVVKYGIALAYGKQVVSDEFVINGKVGGLDVINGEVENLDEKNQYYVALINIPTTQYDTYFTARAYVVLDDTTVVYGAAVQSRALSEVVFAAKKDGAEGAIIDEVFNASETVLNLNGGQVFAKYEFNVSGYTTGGWTGYPINLSKPGADGLNGSAYNYNWTRIGLKTIDAAKGLYKPVMVLAEGEADAPLASCEYVLATHSACTDKDGRKVFLSYAAQTDALDYTIKINGTIPTKNGNCALGIEIDKNVEILNKDKYHFGVGENLPELRKDYYDFVGWCKNADLSDTPSKVQDANRTLYAKYNPINYEIKFELGGGQTTATLPTQFNYESKEILLPAAETMSRTDYKFGGWYADNSFLGEEVKSIPVQSHGNKTFYAKWIADAPVEIVLTEADKLAISKIAKPTIIVRSDFTGGKLTSTFGDYTCGVNAFPTLSAALTVAKDNDIIYVFNGTYSDVLTISKQVKVYGPNTGIKGTATRGAEATLTGNIYVNAKNVEINGIKLDGRNAIKVNADNCTLTCINSTSIPEYAAKETGGNRAGLIVATNDISNLKITNNKFYYANRDSSLTAFVTLNCHATNLVIENNYMEMNKDKTGYEALMLYRNDGTLDINNNEIYYNTGQWIIQIANLSSTCSVINIKDNILSGSKDHTVGTSGISMLALSGSTVLNYIHNSHYGVGGNKFKFANAKATTIVNIKYNYFDANSGYKLTDKGTATINYENNYYATAQIHSTPDYGKITSLDALNKAYEAYKATQGK